MKPRCDICGGSMNLRTEPITLRRSNGTEFIVDVDFLRCVECKAELIPVHMIAENDDRIAKGREEE